MNSLKERNLLIPFLVALLATILMVSCVFLPYTSATDEYAKVLNMFPDAIMDQALKMTASDMLDLSMVEYANLYQHLGQQALASEALAVVYIVLVALIGGFAALAILFAVLKKPIAIITFSTLSFAVFLLQNADYTDRGVVPSARYDWGIGYYIFYIAFLGAIVGAIWMRTNKRKATVACDPEAST